MFRLFSIDTSFKSKNVLKDFYKYVHPDILVGAPERVREENGRSMQVLNGYLDGIKKNEGSSGVDVRFYTPEKTNRKSKKFYFFKTHLESFPANLKETDIETLRKK